MPQMEIYTSDSSSDLQNKVLEAADLVSVILGIFQCFDLHIITHIGVDLHMDDIAYFFAEEGFAQGGFVADQRIDRNGEIMYDELTPTDIKKMEEEILFSG